MRRYETIHTDLSDDVGTITLDRPEVRNALNTAMRLELREAILDLSGRARVLVLAGAGGAFCSGQDLSDAGDISALDLERLLNDEYVPLVKAIHDCPLPVVAAVNGAAAGAGANLALAADVVIASERSVFLQAFTRIGLIPDAGGTYWLPRQIGFARAMGAMLFAEPVTARQAADWGMIWEAVPDEDFAAHVHRRATSLAQGPTLAFGQAKSALRASFANDLDTQLALEARAQGACGASHDFHEGVNAFLEKRRPRFQGR